MSHELRGCNCSNSDNNDSQSSNKVRLETLIAILPLVVATTAWLVSLQSRVDAERAFSRSICHELRRLTEELGKIPTNDCSRP